jgi:hypothetical protein
VYPASCRGNKWMSILLILAIRVGYVGAGNSLVANLRRISCTLH